MKQYTIDLTEYKIKISSHKRVDGELKIVEREEVYPLKENLSNWLRQAGAWKDGTEAMDAYMLARQFKDYTRDSIELNENEMALLKKVMDKLISQEPDPAKGIFSLGGEIHEECITRIYSAKEE